MGEAASVATRFLDQSSPATSEEPKEKNCWINLCGDW